MSNGSCILNDQYRDRPDSAAAGSFPSVGNITDGFLERGTSNVRKKWDHLVLSGNAGLRQGLDYRTRASAYASRAAALSTS